MRKAVNYKLVCGLFMVLGAGFAYVLYLHPISVATPLPLTLSEIAVLETLLNIQFPRDTTTHIYSVLNAQDICHLNVKVEFSDCTARLALSDHWIDAGILNKTKLESLTFPIPRRGGSIFRLGDNECVSWWDPVAEHVQWVSTEGSAYMDTETTILWVITSGGYTAYIEKTFYAGAPPSLLDIHPYSPPDWDIRISRPWPFANRD
jgi:hypothetical protein